MAVGAGGIGLGIAVGGFAGFSTWQWWQQNQAINALKNDSYETEGYDRQTVDEARFMIELWELAPVYAIVGMAQLAAGGLIAGGSGLWYWWLKPAAKSPESASIE